MTPQAGRFSRFLFGHYAYAGTFATYASLFFAARGMSAAQVGVLMALIQVMRIVGPNLWGTIADHTGRHAAVLRFIALAAVPAFCSFFLAGSFGALFACMLLVNLFTTAQPSLCEALALSEMRGDLSNYGRVRLWGSVGFIVAVTSAGYALEHWGVEALLWIGIGLLLPVAGVSCTIREVPTAHDTQAERPPVLRLLMQRDVALFFASWALMVAAHMALYVYYSLYLERNGYGKGVIGIMWSLGVLAEIVLFRFQARLFRRFGARRVMLAAFAVAVFRFVAIGAEPDMLAVLVLAQLLHAFTFAAHHSASIITMQRWFSGPLQARGQALYISIGYGVGGTAGSLFMALCWERLGAAAVYYAAAALAALGMLCAHQNRGQTPAGSDP